MKTYIDSDKIELKDYGLMFLETEHIPDFVINELEKGITNLLSLDINERYRKFFSLDLEENGIEELGHLLDIDPLAIGYLQYLTAYNDKDAIYNIALDVLAIENDVVDTLNKILEIVIDEYGAEVGALFSTMVSTDIEIGDVEEDKKEYYKIFSFLIPIVPVVELTPDEEITILSKVYEINAKAGY